MNAESISRFCELPLLAKELNEQAAQRRTYLVRFLYAGILFTAACGMFYGSFLQGTGGSAGGLGQGRQMFEQLVGLQFWTIFLFLPAISCGCLSIEKERNTLGLLLITTLSPWQIVVQKLLGRLVPMLTFVVLSFPLMAVAYSFGGITADYLWSGIVILVLTCVEAAALSVMCSAWYPTTVEAFIGNYVLFLTLLYTLPWGWGPWLFQQASDITFAESLASLWFPAALTGAFLFGARRFVESRAFVPPKNVLLGTFQRLDRFFNEANAVTGGIVLVRDGDPLPGAEPVAWRETTKKSLGTFRYLFRVLVLLELPLILVCSTLSIGMSGGPNIAVVSRFLYILWILAAAMIIVHAGSVMAAERTRQTLDVLLATPLAGEQILKQKLGGVWRLIRVLLVPFLTIYAFEVWWFTGSDYRWTYLILSFMSIIYLPLLAWLALWTGLKIGSQMKAVLGTLALVAVWLLAPQVVRAIFDDIAGTSVPVWIECLLALNPADQIVAIEELNTTGRLASSKATQQGFLPFLILSGVNFLLHGLMWYLVRRRCLAQADKLLGRLSPEPFPVPVDFGLGFNLDVAVDLGLARQPQVLFVTQPGEEGDRPQ
ncbi:MAG TPA: ABC transporter permease subunit [Planctomycetaceae bacterium]|jgi:ABC-type transport system involved in multi-copper enzyme maturation permease subunit